MKSWQIRVPRFFRSYYFISSFLLLFWMCCCDNDSFIDLYKSHQKLSEMREKEAYYQKKIEEVKKDRRQLMEDEELVEKFAREKYLMKRPEEDLFVVVEK